MAQKEFFNGKKIFEPGVYAKVASGRNVQPQQVTYGNVLLIDNGAGAAYGSGPGIAGTLALGPDAVQSFDSLNAFKTAVKGGIFWKLAENLFSPNGLGTKGISKLIYVRAATTVPATMTFTVAATGALVIKARSEGLVGNGGLTSTELTTGYAFKLRKITTSAYVLDIYQGTFKGLDSVNAVPWDLVTAAVSKPILVYSSEICANITQMYGYMLANASFMALFSVTQSAGTGTIADADVTTYAAYTLATGGTESYATSGLLALCLEEVKEIDYSFILSDIYGVSTISNVPIAAMIAHLKDESRFGLGIVIGGGYTSTDFLTTSVAVAVALNTERAIVVQGGYQMAYSGGYYTYYSIFKAALVLGRMCGLAPQVPLTWKPIKFDKEIYTLTAAQREVALDSGVLHTKYDPQLGFIINQGINTLQSNSQMLNNDGTSPEISITRIVNLLNKEIQLRAVADLFSQVAGVNRNTLTPKDVKNWLEGYLQSRTASDTKDDLILGYENVAIQEGNNAYHVTYSFYPNYPINSLFITGFILDPNL